MRECWVCWASAGMEDIGADACRGCAGPLLGDGEFVDLSVIKDWGSMTLDDLRSSKETRFGEELDFEGDGGTFAGEGG
jgi:hypothetical protein